jgi:hypothetical protein
MTGRMTIFGLLVIIGLGTMAACVRVGEIQEETMSVPLQGAESAHIKLRLAAGELRIRGAAAAALISGDFRYNIPRWKPAVDQSLIGSKAEILIEQRQSSGLTYGRIRNSWDLEISNRVPLELETSFGAGQADLDLRGLQLSRLDVHTGVGDVAIDLSGERSVSLTGRIKGGIGRGTIYLPSGVGSRVYVDGGLGRVDAPGFMRSDRVYTNDAFGKTAVEIRLEVKAGIGEIDLRLR